MRILISGASGFIGRSLVVDLRGTCNQALSLVRGRPAASQNEFGGPADLVDIENWPSWPRDIDVLVHLAAFNPSRGDPRGHEIGFLRRVNVEGTAALAKRAQREGVRRMIFLSSAHVHARVDDRDVQESDSIEPQNAYAASKKEAEDVFWGILTNQGVMKGCVLRPAPVYGRGSRGSFAMLRRLAQLPLPLPIGGLGCQRSLLSVDHLVEVIQLCINREEANGQTFLVADDGPLALHEIVRALRSGWGRPAMILPGPRRILNALIRSAGKEELWRNVAQSFILDTRHIESVLGWRSPVNAERKLYEMAVKNRI